MAKKKKKKVSGISEGLLEKAKRLKITTKGKDEDDLYDEIMEAIYEQSEEADDVWLSKNKDLVKWYNNEAEKESEGGTEEKEEEPEEEKVDVPASEDEVMELDRDELETLVEQEGLDVDPDDYKKNKKGLKEFQAGVIEEMDFSEEESEEPEEKMDVPDSEDSVRELDRDELVTLVEQEEMDADPEDFKDSKKGLIKFQDAVIEELEIEEDEPDVKMDVPEDADEVRELDRDELVTLVNQEELDTDPDDYKKNKKGLTEFQDSVMEDLDIEEEEEEPEPEKKSKKGKGKVSSKKTRGGQRKKIRKK